LPTVSSAIVTEIPEFKKLAGFPPGTNVLVSDIIMILQSFTVDFANCAKEKDVRISDKKSRVNFFIKK